MRVRNLSDLQPPRALWSDLATAFGVGGELRRAREDDLGIYSGDSPRITINPRRERPHRNEVVGSYTYGHVALYPCSICSTAFLTWVYLHELVHAWVDEYRSRSVYQHWEACPLADELASRAFAALGGVETLPEGTSRVCQGYEIDLQEALMYMHRVKPLAAELRRRVPKGRISRRAARTGVELLRS